jgi:hypothetical protein
MSSNKIEGHADNTGKKETNMKLSAQIAANEELRRKDAAAQQH